VDEYRKYIEKDAALERRFQQVTVEDGAGWSWIQMDWCGLIWINMD
jgi:ATP-dependent Clp protease ATP-binding subunit ClpA